jgi:hypothetical protein
MPSLLVFETDGSNRELHTFIPNRSITVPGSTLGSTSEYHLRAIIYHGGYHFTARMIHEDQIWEYDGQHNCGDATREIQDLTEQDLQILRGRSAHTFLYTPKPVQGGEKFSRISLEPMLTTDSKGPYDTLRG